MAPNPRTREGSRGTTSVDGCARATEAACTAADRAALRPPARFRPVTGAPGAAYWTSALARPAFSPAARKGIVARAVRALSAGKARLWRRQPCATPSSSSHVTKQYSAFRALARESREHLARPWRCDATGRSGLSVALKADARSAGLHDPTKKAHWDEEPRQARRGPRHPCKRPGARRSGPDPPSNQDRQAEPGLPDGIPPTLRKPPPDERERIPRRPTAGARTRYPANASSGRQIPRLAHRPRPRSRCTKPEAGAQPQIAASPARPTA